MLVTPVSRRRSRARRPRADRESPDPTRDVETATQLVTNTTLPKRVKAALDSDESTAGPAQARRRRAGRAEQHRRRHRRGIVPEWRRDLANAFARQAVAERTDEPARPRSTQPDPQLRRSSARSARRRAGLARLPDRPARSAGGAAPTRRCDVQTPADAADLPGLPAPGAQHRRRDHRRADPRRRRRLRRPGPRSRGCAARRSCAGTTGLPILGRIPKEARPSEQPARRRAASPPSTGEAYRALRATLAGSGRTRRGGKVILVTGSSPSEGKTTTAVNLATSLALAGKPGDPDRVGPAPAGARRGHGRRSPRHGGVVSVLIENTTLAESLTASATYGPNLRLLLADYEGGWIAELFSIPTAEQMIEDARAHGRLRGHRLARPLNEVVDALPLALQADEVLIVVRLGITRLDKLAQLARAAGRERRPPGRLRGGRNGPPAPQRVPLLRRGGRQLAAQPKAASAAGGRQTQDLT